MKLVIVGGGYVGVQLAHAMDAHADVVMIERKTAFSHSAAMVRGVLCEETFEKSLIPYDQLLKRGELITGEAEEISGNGVRLKDDRTVIGDVIVIATGSSHLPALKPMNADLSVFRRYRNTLANDIDNAKTVTIVGAGPVGIELAGEIAAKGQGQTVQLISDQNVLLPYYRGKLAAILKRQLREFGVSVLLNHKVRELECWTDAHAGDVTFENGQRVSSDLIIPVMGSRPNNQLLKTLPPVSFDDTGRVKADMYLRPSDNDPYLFALGDVCATGDGMTIVGVNRQVEWFTKVLKNIMVGKAVTRSKPYSAWPVAPIIVPLGAEKGASVLPFRKIEGTYGNWMTSRLKGRDLFIPKYNRFLNRPSAQVN